MHHYFLGSQRQAELCEKWWHVLLWIGVLYSLSGIPAALAARSDLNGDGRADLAGITDNGGIYYSTDLRTWSNIPGVLNRLVVGDFNGDGQADLAGLTSAGQIFYSTNRTSWNYIPGLLNQLVVGDFNGDGKADLAGLASNGTIYYTTDLRSWRNIPGVLKHLVVGDFNGDGKADLAGLAGNGTIYYTTDLTRWQNIPGILNQLVAGDFNDDGYDDLAGLTSNGGIYYSLTLTTWQNIPGILNRLVIGDFDGDGQDDLAGLTANGGIYYSTDFIRWQNIPGVLNRLAVGDFDGDGLDDLAGLTSNGQIFYSINLTTWHNIPGILNTIMGGNGQAALNQRPTAVIGPNQTVTTGTPVKLDGSGSFDPDGDPLSFSWKLLSVPLGSSISDIILKESNTANPSFFPGSVSSSNITLRDFTYNVGFPVYQDAGDSVQISVESTGGTITTDLPGIYELELVVSDGQLKSDPLVTKVITKNTFVFDAYEIKEFKSIGPVGALVSICLTSVSLGDNERTYFTIAAEGPILSFIPKARGGALGFIGQKACLDIILE